MLKIAKVLALSTVLGAGFVAAPAHAWWGGPGSGWGNNEWGPFDGSGWGDFNMSMGGGGRGYGRQYNNYNYSGYPGYYGGYAPAPAYGAAPYGGYAPAPYAGYGVAPAPYAGYGAAPYGGGYAPAPYAGYGVAPYGAVPPASVPAPAAPEAK
ncbi:sulfur globule family protein [Beggiatoa leptomitoformis]|uniref:sulfur globule family protein n=1 Tax=Beggiatoa leptomitoformis TaxID=288004 RepID=UPI00070625ED|nr:sulfur globule family protein [Beggiatoa leptomitoformis]ALG67575.1 sulfur globule protein CV1 [Beggiatoa leptomitoformis]